MNKQRKQLYVSHGRGYAVSWWRKGMAALWGLVLVFGLSGCGGEETAALEQGEVLIGITDADGDFLSYAVDVNSLTLTRADGTTVETLPRSTRIDFSQYVELTELLTSATIPSGRYVKATLVLDYSQADIQVEVAGAAVAAQVRDGDGQPIGIWETSVTLDDRHSLRVAPGIPAHLTLDFDLESSNRVDLGTTPPTVTAAPMLVADVQLEEPKPHRLRGLLGYVNQEREFIRMAVRPFAHHQGQFGELQVHVLPETHYEIDGVPYGGNEGLAQMAGLAPSTWMVVEGQLNPIARRFEAREVYAGASVPGSDQDGLVGVVLSRSGDELTVHARSIVRTDGSLEFNREVIVTLAGGLKITRQLAVGELGKEVVSVGQRLTVLGTLTDNGGQLTMATPSHMRLLMNQITGSAVQVNDGELVMALQRINGRAPSRFDFSGTGVSAAQDADPANYQVDSGLLSLAGINVSDPVKARGFVTPFGSAPADYAANTVINVADTPAMMSVTWPVVAASPFISQGDTAVVPDLTATEKHHVRRQWVHTDLTTLGAVPTIQATASGNGIFAIHSDGSVRMYTTFADFNAALAAALDGSVGLSRLMAKGQFDDATATLTSRNIHVMLAPLVAP